MYIDTINEYVNYLKVTNFISPLTRKLYLIELTLFFKIIGDLPLNQITQQNILTYLDYIQQRSLSHSTIKKKILVLKGFFKWLLNEGKISKNPLPNMKNGRNGYKKLIKVLSDDQISKLLSKDEKLSFRDLCKEVIIRIFLATGIRKQELLDLEISDVQDEELVIRHGKGDRERIVRFDRSTKEWLNLYLNRQKPFRKTSMNLFIHESGKPIDEECLRYMIDVKLKKAGVKYVKDGKFYGKGIGCHIFRHSFSTRFLENGGDVKVLQELLGHADAGTTLNFYAHPSREYKKSEYRKANPLRKLGRKSIIKTTS